MSTLPKLVRGDRFPGPVYRDPWRIILAVDTTKANPTYGFKTPAAINTLLTAARAFVAGDSGGEANGILELGAGESAEITAVGTDADNEITTIFVSRILPVFDPNASDPTAPVAYIETQIVQAASLLSALAAGAAGAAIDGVAATDLVIDQPILLAAGTRDTVEAAAFAAADYPGYVTLEAGLGDAIYRAYVNNGTSTSSGVIARRIQGAAQNRR